MNAQPVRRRAPLRVVVVEDHCELRRRLVEAIDSQSDMHCIASVAAAEQVVQAACRANADVVVLDLMLEGANALHLIRDVKAALPGTRIIVYSGYASPVLAGEARCRGASGYVPKSGAVDELLLEIRTACYCGFGARF
ncbi:MAG: response regulator transcription factor [Steroidobacteraceae bacterium]|jgi:DNA-binding NarL/FixJ family response regulator|nr:response regulator transcription factor [Steroidobacteraceae bacterium]